MDYSKFSVKSLRDIIRKYNLHTHIVGFSRMGKTDLISSIQKFLNFIDNEFIPKSQKFSIKKPDEMKPRKPPTRKKKEIEPIKEEEKKQTKTKPKPKYKVMELPKKEPEPKYNISVMEPKNTDTRIQAKDLKDLLTAPEGGEGNKVLKMGGVHIDVMHHKQKATPLNKLKKQLEKEEKHKQDMMDEYEAGKKRYEELQKEGLIDETKAMQKEANDIVNKRKKEGETMTNAKMNTIIKNLRKKYLLFDEKEKINSFFKSLQNNIGHVNGRIYNLKKQIENSK